MYIMNFACTELQFPSGYTSGVNCIIHLVCSLWDILEDPAFWEYAIFRTLNPDSRHEEHFISSLRASSVKPKDKTALGHAKLDTGTPWVRGEARTGRWGCWCWSYSLLALTPCWSWVNFFIFFSKKTPSEEGMITRQWISHLWNGSTT